MIDLTTHWMGLELPHPLIPGASPLSDNLDGIRNLQDAGAPLVTLRSLVATPYGVEQESVWLDEGTEESHSQSVLAGVQHAPRFATDPAAYCNHIESIHSANGPEFPVIASLYARRTEDWVTNAERIAQAGAAALELNIYGIVVEHKCKGPETQRAIERLVAAVRERVSIPIALKLLPVYPDFDEFAHRVSSAGVAGLVLFNGFQRGDLQLQQIDDPVLRAASSPFDRHSRFRWLARLSGRVSADLGMSGGVREALHAARAILCGANVVQLVSTLLTNGPEQLTTILSDLRRWFATQGYDSLEDIRGLVSQQRFGDFDEFDREYARQILRPTG